MGVGGAFRMGSGLEALLGNGGVGWEGLEGGGRGGGDGAGPLHTWSIPLNTASKTQGREAKTTPEPEGNRLFRVLVIGVYERNE